MHRNSQKRFVGEGFVYFITTVTKYRYPYFENKVLCEVFVEELDICKQLKEFELFAFCVLPDHVHLLIRPNEKYNISKVIQSIKKEFSRDANYLIEGEIPESRLQKRKMELQMSGVNWGNNLFTNKINPSTIKKTPSTLRANNHSPPSRPSNTSPETYTHNTQPTKYNKNITLDTK